MQYYEEAIIHSEKESVLENGDTLLILMEHHNMKEECILYPMAYQDLAAHAKKLLDRIIPEPE